MREATIQAAALAAQLIAVAMLVAGAWCSAGRMTRSGDSGDRLPATAVLLLSACVVINEVLGGLRCIAPVGLFAASTLVGVVAIRWGRRSATMPMIGGAVAPRSALSYLALATATLVLPHAVRALSHVPVAWDELTYHMLKPAVWLYDGRLSRPGLPYPVSWSEYYPANGELVWTTLIGVVKNDLLAHSLNVPLLGALAACIVQLCCSCGASTAAAAALACVLVSAPVVLSFVPTAYVESVLNVSELSAVLFGIRWLQSGARKGTTSAILCGLSSGLAIGTKYSALPIVAALAVALAVGKCWVDGLSRPLFKEAGSACVACLTTGAYWYLRNWRETGNPFYPVPFAGLRHTDDPMLPWGGSSILENFGDLVLSGQLGRAWFDKASYPDYLSAPGIGWFGVLLLGCSLLGIGSAAARTVTQLLCQRRTAATHGLLCVMMLTTLFTYLRLPFWGHLGWLATQVRFITPFLCISSSAGLGLLEGYLGTKWVFVLAGLGLACNAAQLDLQYPGLDRIQSILLGAAILGGASALARTGHLRSSFAPYVLAAALASLPFVLAHRERERFAQLRQLDEVNRSYHHEWVPCAEYVANNFSGQKVAIAQLSFEYDTIFTGRHFDVRPMYVLTHAGPSEPYLYENGDPRHNADPTIWRRNLVASGASALVITDAHNRPGFWPRERLWMQSIPIAPVDCGRAVVYDIRKLRALAP